MKTSSGFTLMEVLVVVAVLSIFGTALTVIFTRSLIGSSRAQVVGVIKQNGQAALELMDKAIRGADSVVCLDPGFPAKVLVIKKEDSYIRYTFVDPQPSLNGYLKQDHPPFNPNLTDTSTLCAAATLTPNAAPLTDNNQTPGSLGVSVQDGSFQRSRSGVAADLVTVNFKVGPGVQTSPSLYGQIDPVLFQTTIQLRQF